MLSWLTMLSGFYARFMLAKREIFTVPAPVLRGTVSVPCETVPVRVGATTG